jgi:hypothetical protein
VDSSLRWNDRIAPKLYTYYETMKHHIFLHIAAALLIIISLSLTTALPALALDLNPSDYFSFNLNTVTFDKSEVAAGEAFHITITGSANCIKDLPLSISQITITSQVVARPSAGGAAIVLNPSYVIDINPLPNKAGQSFGVDRQLKWDTIKTIKTIHLGWVAQAP